MRIVSIGLALVAGIVIGSPSLSRAQDVVRTPMTQEALVDGRRLLDVLREIATAVPLEVHLDPAVADRPINIEISGLPPELALTQALLASGVDFVTAWRGGRLHVRAGDLAAARDITASLVAEAGVPVGEVGAPRELEADAVADVTSTANIPAGVALGDASGSISSDAQGLVSGAALLALLSPSPRAPRSSDGPILLPFPDATGQPISVPRSTAVATVIQLPFPDATGVPILQPIPLRESGVVELPFPDEFGRPIRIQSSPPAASRPVPPGRE